MQCIKYLTIFYSFIRGSIICFYFIKIFVMLSLLHFRFVQCSSTCIEFLNIFFSFILQFYHCLAANVCTKRFLLVHSSVTLIFLPSIKMLMLRPRGNGLSIKGTRICMEGTCTNSCEHVGIRVLVMVFFSMHSWISP